MESLKLWITLLLLLVVRTDSQICPVLEEKEITLTCTVFFRSNSHFDKTFYWNKRVNGNNSTVGKCDPDIGSCTPFPATLPYTFTMTRLNESAATSNITISSTARTDQGPWFCSSPTLAQDVLACDLKVFATPTSVSCSQPELQNDNVQVTCTGDRVYPQALCQFTWTKNGTQQSTYNVAAKNQTLSQPQNIDYFYPECTWTIPVQTLGFGNHIFKVLMYPNVTGNTATDMTYGRNSSNLTSLEIYRPEVVLESCPQGYIKEGTTVSCTCQEKNNLFLKANVSWSVSTGGSVVVGKQTSTLNFTANRNSSNYICGAEVLGVWSESKTFVPQVAYGPDQVVMKVQINGVDDKTVIDLCGKPLTSQSMTVSCAVPDVRPSATVRSFFNGNVQTVGSAGSVDYPVTSGGNLAVKCTANNTQFSDIYRENTTFLLVREPPDAPVLEPKPGNGQQVTVREGFVKIWCRVDGGYPNVTNLTLNCIGSSTSGPNAISLEMNVTRKMNSGACSCTATHPSTCYVNNSTTSTLNVLYPPTITNFTVTGAVNHTVQANTNVMFSCEAEGNPAPSLIQPRDSLSQIMRQIMSNNKAILEWNKTMACQDSGIYVCKAESSEEEKTMEIYVLCKQQLGSMESQNKVYNIKANETFDINITVIGYPEPQLSLHSSKTLHKNEYNLTYYTTTPGNGIINLKIHTVFEAYNQKYELNITNKQGSFIYSFEIKAENANDNDRGDGSDIGAIIGGIAAGVVVIILVALVAFLLRRKGKKKQGKTTSKKNGSDPTVVIDNGDIYNIGRKDEGFVIDNSDIYNMGRKEEEVVIDNSDIYNMGKSGETVIDNSDIYNMNRDNTVVIDNSDIYNMDRNHAADSRASTYKNYSDITTTMTSATAMPKNMKPVAEEPILDNPYEDVEKQSKSSAPKVQQKPQVAVKPKQAMKPNQGKTTPANTAAGANKGDFQLKDDDVNQTYAVVNKIPKSDTPKQKILKKPGHDDGFPDKSQTPTVPEKKYEKADKEKENGRMKEKAADKNMKGTSPDDTSHVYTNKGYSDEGDDVNVYANT